MTQHQTKAELLSQAVPFTGVMSRKDKLLRWSALVTSAKHPIIGFYNIESMGPRDLQNVKHPDSAFEIAANDPVFKDAGLAGNSAYDAMRFFELSQNELHTFSCGCHGSISNAEMARRMEHLAHNRY